VTRPDSFHGQTCPHPWTRDLYSCKPDPNTFKPEKIKKILKSKKKSFFLNSYQFLIFYFNYIISLSFYFKLYHFIDILRFYLNFYSFFGVVRKIEKMVQIINRYIFILFLEFMIIYLNLFELFLNFEKKKEPTRPIHSADLSYFTGLTQITIVPPILTRTKHSVLIHQPILTFPT
jgi:hypothetical protein